MHKPKPPIKMKAAVVIFPGSNCDTEAVEAFKVLGMEVETVWHNSEKLPEGTKIVILPGGFSFGDYLRCGAFAAKSKIMTAIKKFAIHGGAVIGICNGFQILCEAGLLPGALMINNTGKFTCKSVSLLHKPNHSPKDAGIFGGKLNKQALSIPIAHAEGRYCASEETLDELEKQEKVVLYYSHNPNGSARNIAGIVGGPKNNIFGLMPHPERAMSKKAQGSEDGMLLLQKIVERLQQEC